MKQKLPFLFVLVVFCSRICAAAPPADSLLEPWIYAEHFATRDLGAWESYPHWQDLAYDQNFRVSEIIPGDSNLSLIQKVTSYTDVDAYAGMQKLMNGYLAPGSNLGFRYYIKTNEKPQYYKIRFAAGELGKIDFTINNPETNKWASVTVDYADLVRENPVLAQRNRIRIYALAFLVKIPDADPAMPIYLGLDDILLHGSQTPPFLFSSPAVYKLSEFEPYIPIKAYHAGDVFGLSGKWSGPVRRVMLEIRPYTDSTRMVFGGRLTNTGSVWHLPGLKLDYPEGLYLGTLTAFGDDSRPLYNSRFTIHVVSAMKGEHPRLLFDSSRKQWLDLRLKESRFKGVDESISKNAAIQRGLVSVDSLIYDLDQFPDEDWLPTSATWKAHFLQTGDALWWNALDFSLHGNLQAGEYTKNILLKLSTWPNWQHPWLVKRGRFSEHNTGTWSYRVAEAYDLTYSLMSESERNQIRTAIIKNLIEGVHRTYIVNNSISGNTSNWLAATVGGSLMNMAAIFGDGPETESLEPYFTGALMKLYGFVTQVTDSKDGAWSEGLGYNMYSFYNLSQSIPALKNVFHIDLSGNLNGTYNEFIWAGVFKKREFFNFGDGSAGISPFTYWAFLLDMQKDPRLGWLYNALKQQENLEDVLYETKNVPQRSPFNLNPDKIFHSLGTTVFKSGWEKEDFVFVMRTGAFFNHQHMDQGSFWLADHGVNFIQERGGSAYYDDPIFQSWFIQPVSHSTILVNGNHQSQRIGDELKFAPGFNDHAFIAQSLDGKNAAFSAGDIGRLYWGKLRSLRRNVLFLKPRVVLMLDVAEPADTAAKISLLYQSASLAGIEAGHALSKINKQGYSLNIMHLAPEEVISSAVETPHYLNTLKNDRLLTREGMLTVTATVKDKTLVMANLLTTTVQHTAPAVTTTAGNGFVSGVALGQKFAFTTVPKQPFQVEDIETDALAITWDRETEFVAMGKLLKKNGIVLVAAEHPITFELSGNIMRYDSDSSTTIRLHIAHSPKVWLNDKLTKPLKYDGQRQILSIAVPAGAGTIRFN